MVVVRVVVVAVAVIVQLGVGAVLNGGTIPLAGLWAVAAGGIALNGGGGGGRRLAGGGRGRWRRRRGLPADGLVPLLEELLDLLRGDGDGHGDGHRDGQHYGEGYHDGDRRYPGTQAARRGPHRNVAFTSLLLLSPVALLLMRVAQRVPGLSRRSLKGQQPAHHGSGVGRQEPRGAGEGRYTQHQGRGVHTLGEASRASEGRRDTGWEGRRGRGVGRGRVGSSGGGGGVGRRAAAVGVSPRGGRQGDSVPALGPDSSASLFLPVPVAVSSLGSVQVRAPVS